jgi:hypothetical protein
MHDVVIQSPPIWLVILKDASLNNFVDEAKGYHEFLLSISQYVRWCNRKASAEQQLLQFL